MSSSEEQDRLRQLLEVGRALVTELDTETVLRRIIEAARAITGARYVALGVLGDDRTELERFITSGIDDDTHRAIGALPRGRGVLGVLIADPKPLRLRDVGAHPQSYGFPPAHPPMHSFLGVPILLRGEAWGNLYLAEKAGGEQFTEADEEAAVILAQWAATAIVNARLHERSEQRREQAERALRGLQAARDIAEAIGSSADLDHVLELIVKRGRALVEARSVLIMLREGDELVVAASAGYTIDARGRRLPLSGSTSGKVLEQGYPERFQDASHHLKVAPEQLGVPNAHTALLVPMLHGGTGLGLLAAYDRGREGNPFTQGDEELLRTFASSAANAVALKRSVEADRLRSAVAAAEAERGRWARELHDETLQALGGLRVLLASALRRGDGVKHTEAMRQAIEDIEREIENLRAIITDLRPSLLDDLGLRPALEALLERRREDGLKITAALQLPATEEAGVWREVETTVYRLVQEALTNIIKHAHAQHVRVAVSIDDTEATVEIQDDGVGFNADQRTSGFGLAGMRERVYLAGGTLDVESGQHGTTVSARVPTEVANPRTLFLVADQVAS
jgi:signal transduction histidine kinase